MKLNGKLKTIFYLSFGTLFLSGLIYWLVSMGAEDQWISTRSWSLKVHSIVSLWFFVFFGYFYSKHVEPCLRLGKRIVTGKSLLTLFVVVFLTVPGLFYITSEKWRENVAMIHTYGGLLLLAPFLVHVFLIKFVKK